MKNKINELKEMIKDYETKILHYNILITEDITERKELIQNIKICKGNIKELQKVIKELIKLQKTLNSFGE